MSFAFFLKKTPKHQVILLNAKKHVEGSLFVTNQMQLQRKKSNNTEANSK